MFLKLCHSSFHHVSINLISLSDVKNHCLQIYYVLSPFFALLINVVVLLAKTNCRVKPSDIEKWVKSQVLKLKGAK